MNLYFRMILVFFRSWFGQKKSWKEESILTFRVYPFDCDINFHMTSSRYIGLADLGRIHIMGQMGIFRSTLERRWFPFASGVEFTYIRPIKPFQKFIVRSRIASWDDKYLYFEHRFEVGKRIMAFALARGIFVKDSNVVPIKDVVLLGGADPSSPPPSNTMVQWKKLLRAKKEESISNTADNNG